MLRGYRSIVAAIAGLILIGSSEAPQNSADGQKSHGSKEIQKPVADILLPATEPAKAIEPPEYYQPCGKQGSEGNSDLCAQWQAAKAAGKAADWAWYQMWLSLAGIIGLGITLWFNFRALRLAEKEAKETKDALVIAETNAEAVGRTAHAAFEANSIARESMHRQLRPFVYVAHPNITYHHMHSVEFIGDTAEVILYITNYGKTPAYNVCIIANAYIGGIWNAPGMASLEGREVYLGDIPPTITKPRDGYTVLGLKNAHHEIIAGTSSVFVEGILNYNDAFGETYATRFRFASTERDYPSGVWADCPEGNNAT